MTAATPTIEDLQPAVSAAERASLRSARIRGAIVVALGLFALQFVPSAMNVTATFSFWLTKQGGEAWTISASVGLIWLLTGLVTGVAGLLQLVLGPSFKWRRAMAVV